MNAPERIALPDIQSSVDTRGVAIQSVGVKNVRYPFAVRTASGAAPTIGTWTLGVALPPHVKGTHMSRFVELLEALDAPLDGEALRALGADMLRRLDAESGTIDVAFPLFVRKSAPVSGVSSLLDCEAAWRLVARREGGSTLRVKVVVPATSLCPCSKEISEYGAHNQRSHITLDVEALGAIDAEALVGIAERSASCAVYGLLKRADEKYVTERAYDNPKFVEDLVRDAAVALDADARVGAYGVEAENFESIHNHSAYARVERD
jgi:GTP cyclohydrolase FolE2